MASSGLVGVEDASDLDFRQGVLAVIIERKSVSAAPLSSS
jgi:hypothetical protein